MSTKKIGPQSSTGAWTSKSKSGMGVAEDDKIIWAAFGLSESDNRLAKEYAKVMMPEMRVQAFYGAILIGWFETNREMIEAKVAEHVGTASNVDDLEKKIAALKAQQARLMSALAIKQPPVVVPTSTVSMTPEQMAQAAADELKWDADAKAKAAKTAAESKEAAKKMSAEVPKA